jgi:hypothetical protein
VQASSVLLLLIGACLNMFASVYRPQLTNGCTDLGLLELQPKPQKHCLFSHNVSDWGGSQILNSSQALKGEAALASLCLIKNRTPNYGNGLTL